MEHRLEASLLTWMKQLSGKGVVQGEDDCSGSGVFTPPNPNLKINSPPDPNLVRSEESHWCSTKIKLPEFFGDDPKGWIAKAERYFDTHGTPPPLRIRVAQLSMTGIAQHWFSVVKEIYEDLSWDQLTHELFQRFSGLEIQNPYGQLSTIQQRGTISDYINDFEDLLSWVPHLPEPQSLGYFLAGLCPDVRRWVRLHRPQTRLQAMCLAKDVDTMHHPSESGTLNKRYRYQGQDRFGDKRPNLSSPYLGQPEIKAQGPPLGSNRTIPPRSDVSKSSIVQHLPNTTVDNHQSAQSPRYRGSQTLTLTEWEERRKGLCFRCGQQFGPGHRCPEARLQVILLADDEIVAEDGEIRSLDDMGNIVPTELKEMNVGECSILDFYGAVKGSPAEFKTVKLEGCLLGIPIVMLVDCGASHNFVSYNLALDLTFLVKTFSGIQLKRGNVNLGASSVDNLKEKGKRDSIFQWLIRWKGRPKEESM